MSFLVFDYLDQAMEALLYLNDLAEDGRIVHRAEMTDAFENIPTTAMRMFNGKNIGKSLLKVSDVPLPIFITFVERLIVKFMSPHFL
mmetsp:Transcript_44918/g.137171  ORF Transcript_44918/g.137171 Transcript_44918/m.137171 type:complete len:87 (-) Transcript_44918:764-1024(-)